MLREPGRPKDSGSKPLADNRPALRIAELQRRGYLRESTGWMLQFPRQEFAVSGLRSGDRLDLMFGDLGIEGTPQEQSIALTSTDCPYGGTRPWFMCGGLGEDECGRRVGVLYFVPEQGFACRHCHRLAYQSQRQQVGDRCIEQALKIRAALWKGLDAAGREEFKTRCAIFEQLRDFPGASLFLAPQRPPGMRTRRYINLHERHADYVLRYLRGINDQHRRHYERMLEGMAIERQRELDEWVQNAREEAASLGEQMDGPTYIRIREKRGNTLVTDVCIGPDGERVDAGQFPWPEIEWPEDEETCDSTPSS